MRTVGRGLRRVVAEPMGLLGLVLVALLLLTGLFADWLAPYDPNQISRDRLAGPSWEHPVGTDHLGRDVLSRVIKGTQIALFVSVTATLLSMAGGLVLGLLAGYGPRWLDHLLVLLFDSTYAFPRIMLALAVVTILGPSLGTVILVVVVTTIPAYARLVRISTMSLKSADFILAERSMGASTARILSRHVLPNVAGPLFIVASMDIPSVITLEAGLTFLGLGVRPPAPSWGRILNDGYAHIFDASWVVVGGSVPLILATLGFTFLGESLRDVIDPRLRLRT
ncbi:MAG: ABC transporter permease [Rhodospirillaceae bacterium]|nr:ABC transporter permease [Rhodospirillaceae bacterium]